MWNGKLPAEDEAMTAYLDGFTDTTNGHRDPASNNFSTPPAGCVGLNNFFHRERLYRPPLSSVWMAKSLDGLNGSEFAFDRVGLLTHRKGGGKPHAIYFDKLTYTATSGSP